MKFPSRIPTLRYCSSLGCALLVSAGLANAQAALSSSSPDSTNWSSSHDGTVQLASAEAPASAALPSAPAPAGSGAGQDDSNTYSGWRARDIKHRLTFEAGAGASAPAGDKQYITWGSDFLVGGGVNINQNLAAFLEYQFLDNKVPGAIISQSGAMGGKYHIWSFTVDPVYDLFPKSSNDVYIVGGGGFYRKTTNFTDLTAQEYCSYFGYCGVGYAPSTVGKLSSNQGGFNIGGGYQHRFGGMYGEGKTRFFAEIRYLDVLSPAAQGKTPSGGLNPVTIAADTKLLPITVGFRW